MRSLVPIIGAFAIGLWGLFLLSCERGPADEERREIKSVIQGGEWPENPQRLVSMAPSMTEALFALGYGEQVVAVTRYCDYPPQVQELPKIGGMLDPDLEAILDVEPDLVLGDIQGADHRIAARLDRAGVAYGFLEMSDVEGVEEGLLTLGKWLGSEGRAREVSQRLARELAAVSERVKKSHPWAGKRALLVYAHEPLVAAGPDTFGQELLELAGLKNALAESERAYPVLDKEGLIGLAPELIVDVGTGRDQAEVQRFWASQRGVKAADDGHVIFVDDPVMGRPGPRLPAALELLGRALQELARAGEAP